ncbi:MAG: hypothetical protein ACXVBQ_12070 [Pseudobdellovibrionaceae bacterium]
MQLSIYVSYSPVSSTQAAQTLLTTQVPKTLATSDGATVNYELGMRFISNKAGYLLCEYRERHGQPNQQWRLEQRVGE